jgi:hypothetical protein
MGLWGPSLRPQQGRGSEHSGIRDIIRNPRGVLRECPHHRLRGRGGARTAPQVALGIKNADHAAGLQVRSTYKLARQLDDLWLLRGRATKQALARWRSRVVQGRGTDLLVRVEPPPMRFAAPRRLIREIEEGQDETAGRVVT